MNRRALLNLGIQLLPTLAFLDPLTRSTQDPSVCQGCRDGIEHECGQRVLLPTKFLDPVDSSKTESLS